MILRSYLFVCGGCNIHFFLKLRKWEGKRYFHWPAGGRDENLLVGKFLLKALEKLLKLKSSGQKKIQFQTILLRYPNKF